MSGEISMNDDRGSEMPQVAANETAGPRSGDVAPESVRALFGPGMPNETIDSIYNSAHALEQLNTGDIDPNAFAREIPPGVASGDLQSLVHTVAPEKSDAIVGAYHASGRDEDQLAPLPEQQGSEQKPEGEEDMVPFPDVVQEGKDILEETRQTIEDVKSGRQDASAMDKVMQKFQEWSTSKAAKFAGISLIVAICTFYVLLILSFRMAGGRQK